MVKEILKRRNLQALLIVSMSIIIVFMFIVYEIRADQQEDSSNMKQFVSKEAAFQLMVPSDWFIQESKTEKIYRCVISEEQIETMKSEFQTGLIIERAIDFKKAYKSDPSYSSDAETFILAKTVEMGKYANGPSVILMAPPGSSTKQLNDIIEEAKESAGVTEDLTVSFLTDVSGSSKSKGKFRYEIIRGFKKPDCMLFLYQVDVDGKKWFSVKYQAPCTERGTISPIFKEIASTLKIESLEKK